MADHEHIGPILASLERTWSAAAHDHAEKAEQARHRKAESQTKHIGMPDEYRQRLDMQHDDEIAHHDRQARIHRRRAEHAAAGYMLNGPDETSDAHFQREHGPTIAMAQRTGRCRMPDDRII